MSLSDVSTTSGACRAYFNENVRKLKQGDKNAEGTGFTGAEKLSGLVIIHNKNAKAKKLNREAIVSACAAPFAV